MTVRRGVPDFVIVGAPKAGTTALHDALATHPQLYASPIKEPKFFLTGGVRPAWSAHRGPGDAHSAREWVWQPERYHQLFDGAPAGALRFESTPFYLWQRASHERIARAVPHAKLIAIIRDPIDRAFSNWTHLRADGLEPEPDFLRACRLEPQRIAKGWAPFWRYLELGRCGEQLSKLFRYIDPARVRVVRYRELVDAPRQTLDELCAFLEVDTGHIAGLPDSNLGRWTADGWLNAALRRVVRLGAKAGGHVHPSIWRTAQRPLVAVLRRGNTPRPRLEQDIRAQLVADYADDNALLGRLLGTDFSDWLAINGRGTYTVRRSWDPSAAVASK